MGNGSEGLDIEGLLAEALERLLRRGVAFDAITVQALAREAGIARSSFYLHFRGKPALVARLLERVVEDITAGAGDWFAHPEAADETTLLRAVEGVVAVYRRRAAVMQAVAQAASHDPAAATLMRNTLRDLLQRNRRVLQRAAANRRIRADLSLEVGDVLLWMMERCSAQLETLEDPREQARLVRALAFVVAHSLFADAPPPERSE